MRDILTVTLNPALDISTEVDGVVPGLKLRCDAPRADPGGGGINVSRAIRLLGGHARTFAVLTGATGARMAQILTETGHHLITFSGATETRQSLAVIDRLTGAQYRFMLPGPDWPEDVAPQVIERIEHETQPGSIVVISGSLPPGCQPEVISQLVAKLNARRVETIVDTSGKALHHVAGPDHGAPPTVLRMNMTEADDLAGRPLRSLAETADFASSLVARGIATIAIVARGPEGSVLATAEGRWHSHAADVPVRSKVGAGDSFVGAFTLAFSRGMPLPDCLSWGVASGSAAVMTEGTALCEPEDFNRLLPLCPAAEI
ncbi:1-phosphofructokinase family hexose kinase [Pseudoroseicyclus sp. CXY001]|uniref:1-phosphofructokinase family hexose kinase n=1 Tax=Pseudoroseicyclus sp. CXY001 TaxID=3242492 RepID=UPI003570B3EF